MDAGGGIYEAWVNSGLEAPQLENGPSAECVTWRKWPPCSHPPNPRWIFSSGWQLRTSGRLALLPMPEEEAELKGGSY